MATRHQVRQAVVSLLYALEFNSQNDEFVDEFLHKKKIRNEQKKFTLSLYQGVYENMQSIDEAINGHLNENTIAKLGYTERAILRLGVYELLFTDTIKAIVINEAVELAKELAHSPQLINGILDSLAKK